VPSGCSKWALAPGFFSTGLARRLPQGRFELFDVAFLAAVLGEVPDKAARVHSVARVLRPGGLLVFVEAFPDPDRMSVSFLRQLVEPEGFDFERCNGTAWRDVVRFRRVRLP
jgi:ubiquinone/menaquinone biosynthesis C-methylase UbiE